MAGSKMDVRTKVGTNRVTPLKIGLFIALALGIIMAPILAQGTGQLLLVRVMAIIGIYVLLALGLNIVVGYAGLLDLGYIAFYAMGSYVGILVSTILQNKLHLGPFTFFVILILGAAAAAATGIALGTPVLRLRGDYLAIVTLGFGEIVRIAATNNFLGLTNGANGVSLPEGVAPLGMTWLTNNVAFGSGDFSFRVTENVYWYFMIVLLCLLAIFIIRRLDDSRLGRSWVAMREDEVAASSVGVNITTTKLWAFSLGALWGGIAGVVWAYLQGFVTPESFTFMESVFVVCIVVLGGMGSIPGVIVGAIVIQGVPEIIRFLAASGLVQFTSEQQTLVQNYRYLVFGLLMVIMMAFRPQGMIPSSRRARELHPEDEKIREEESESLWEAENKTEIPPENF